MSRPLIVRAAAQADIREIHDYLLTECASEVPAFESSLERLFERIESMPFLYGEYWKDVRAARIQGFRYILYYAVLDDRIDVFAVIHASRDPAVWKARR